MNKVTAARLIEQAKTWVGYCEKASNRDLEDFTANSGSSNYTRFNRDYAEVMQDASAQPEQWCGIFVSMMFVYEFGIDKARELLCGDLYKYTPTGAQRFKNAGRYIKRGSGTPIPGDVVFFYSSSKGRIAHTGIVYKVSSSKVYTIEGNTSGTAALVTNGGSVELKSYSLTSSYVDGYGRPDYSGEASGTGGIKLGDRLLKIGICGSDVKLLQEYLTGLGYDVGTCGVDGEYGADTCAAVKAFQHDSGLDEDGEYGPNTHSALMSKVAPDDGAVAGGVVEEECDLKVTGGSVYVRTGPGTEYSIVSVVYAGDKLKAIDADGWTAIDYDGQLRWISNKYVERCPE